MIGVAFFLVLFFMVLLYTFIKVITNGRRINELESQVPTILDLKRRIAALESELERAAGVKLPIPSPPVVKEAPAPAVAESVELSLHADPHLIPQQARTASPPPSAAPSRTREEWEAFVGGKLLNRIGAFALILGVGFSLKYAFDNDWISESLRVIVGAVAGLACLAGAYRTHAKGFQIFAQGLVGAGIAILYLSTYAAFNYYQLVPQTLAFVLMSVVTILALGQGLLYNSFAVALLGWAGAFLTPTLLSTGTNNEIGLFSYLALANIGLLAVLFRSPKWYVLEPLSFGATWLYYISWNDQWYTPDELGVTVFFVLAFWFVFFAADAVRLTGLRRPALLTQHSAAIANAVVVFFALFAMIDPEHHDWMGATTLLLAVPYAGLAVAVRRNPLADRFTAVRNDLVAIALLVIATAIEFVDFETVRWWTIEAAALMMIGFGYRQRIVWRSAFFLLILAIARYVITDGAFSAESARAFVVLWNARAATVLVLAFGSAFAVWLLRRAHPEDLGAERPRLLSGFELITTVLAFLLITIELNDLFRSLAIDQPYLTESSLLFVRLLVIGMTWVVFAIVVNEAADWMRSEMLAAASVFLALLGGLLIVIRGVSFEPIDDFTPLFNLRVGLMLVTGAGMALLISRIRTHAQPYEWTSKALGALGVGVVAIAFFLLTGEAFDHYRLLMTNPDLSSPELQRLQNLQQLILSTVWLCLSVVLMVIGIWRGMRMQRVIAFALFGITILKIFIYDLSFLETLYRIFSFVGLGVILLAVSYAYQRYKELIFGTSSTTEASPS